MSKIVPMIKFGSVPALFFVLLTISASAQVLPATSAAQDTPQTLAGLYAGATGVPNVGTQPVGALGGTYGNMYGGVDPERQAFLNARLQNLRMAESQINNDIIMSGGEASPAARPLVMQRTQLQNQIRSLEQELGAGSMGAAATGMGATPGAMGAATLPDAGAYGMSNNMGGAYGAYGMAGAGMGAQPDRMMLEQMRQEAMADLSHVQRLLSLFDPTDPARAEVVARQSELLQQVESIDRQLGRGNAAGMTTPGAATNTLSPQLSTNAAGSDSSLAQQLLAQQTQQAAARSNSAAMNPQLQQMREVERRLRVMGETAAADDLRRQIEAQELAGVRTVNPQAQAPIMLPMAATIPAARQTAPSTAQPTTADIVRQAEMLELRNTVESLREEIASMREEIRSLETLLRQLNQLPVDNELAPYSPELPYYPDMPLTPDYDFEDENELPPAIFE